MTGPAGPNDGLSQRIGHRLDASVIVPAKAERLEEPCPLVFEEEIELQGPVAAASCGCRLSLEMDGVVPHVGS